VPAVSVERAFLCQTSNVESLLAAECFRSGELGTTAGSIGGSGLGCLLVRNLLSFGFYLVNPRSMILEGMENHYSI
jgi:hypothetical protein